MTTDSKIKAQVKLPASVAFEVVLQGIKIRIGRSIVTVMGIMLGIAFLMAILSGEVIKSGVAAEEQLRSTVRQMSSFLAAEVGPPDGRNFGILLLGDLSPAETRFVGMICKRAGRVRYFPHPRRPAPEAMKPAVRAELDAVADGAHALIAVGSGELPEMDPAKVLAGARNKVLAVTRGGSAPDIEGVAVVPLQRELREGEALKIRQDRAKAAFRRNWIVIISLVVTVICITNSMLMSVTERFREIGTMKCLGALSSFIRQMFLIESSLMGLMGSAAGGVAGLVFSLFAYSATYGLTLVAGSLSLGPIALAMLGCVAVGMVLSVLAALYPARVASRMVPANALRTNV